MKNTGLYSRRQIVKSTLALGSLALFTPWYDSFGTNKGKRKYKISACDWSVGKLSEVEAVAVAKEIGLNGIQISLGTVQNNMHLRQPVIQQAYKQAAKKYGIEISSLAIGELNKIPYKSEPQTEEWVSDSIDVAKAMGCKVILLAFFENGDIKNDIASQQEVIKRLKRVAPKAEQAGIILGIESWLSAEEHVSIIKAIGSKNVQVYYDVANSHKMGYDIYAELVLLGKNYICEVHAKENTCLLGKGEIDFSRVKKILDDVGYNGWVVLEGSRESADMLADYKVNRQFLQSVFG